jgi:DNA integrity scanning protein DisA with diadenylate cyclase activity
MRESRSLNVFVGIMIFVIVWFFVSQILEMRLLGSILDKLVSVGVIALIVIFQEDIRKFLYDLGAHQRVRTMVRFFSPKKAEENDKTALKRAIIPIVMACMSMSKGKVGALIVIERHISLSDIVSTGETINADINQRLIENIFFKNSPLHDGAMIISHQRILAAGCILPVSHNLDIPRTWACATVPPSASRRRAMPCPSSFPKRREASRLHSTDSSVCVSLPRSSNQSLPPKWISSKQSCPLLFHPSLSYSGNSFFFRRNMKRRSWPTNRNLMPSDCSGASSTVMCGGLCEWAAVITTRSTSCVSRCSR